MLPWIVAAGAARILSRAGWGEAPALGRPAWSAGPLTSKTTVAASTGSHTREIPNRPCAGRWAAGCEQVAIGFEPRADGGHRGLVCGAETVKGQNKSSRRGSGIPESQDRPDSMYVAKKLYAEFEEDEEAQDAEGVTTSGDLEGAASGVLGGRRAGSLQGTGGRAGARTGVRILAGSWVAALLSTAIIFYRDEMAGGLYGFKIEGI